MHMVDDKVLSVKMSLASARPPNGPPPDASGQGHEEGER
jgi:hypothetical protein